jgi:hypothetical protein
MSREPEQDRWLGSTLRQSPALPTDVCLDAETLAAWADGGLTAQAAAAVELHTSNCSRCMAVLAAMERSAPVASPRPAWTPARVFRWLAPLTAAAAAIVIWVVVPDRPITPEQRSAAVQDLQVMRPRADDAAPRNEVAVPEQALQQSPAPSTQNQEPPAADKLLSRKAPDVRDESRRERAATLSASADAAADAQPEAAAPPAARSPSARFMAPADAPAETTAARDSAFNLAAAGESIDPSNPLVRWRVVAPALIERSTDGGKTWTSVSPLPGTSATTPSAFSVAAVRAVDAERAVVRTSDGREFYTTNGGRSWTAVQENSKAPF